MTKRLAIAFATGAVTPLLCALYLGGENIAQAGLRLAAIEQGFSLASRHWQFEATPAQEIAVAQWNDPLPASSAVTKKPRPMSKRR